MEHYSLRLRPGRRTSFDDAPPVHRRRAFGVDYLTIRGLQGGEFHFTRAGWALGPSLLPRGWFDGDRLRRLGRPLQKATGSVYWVPVPHPARGRVGVVVKFCRFAQHVGCTHLDPGLFPREVEERVQGAQFAGPFEEFGRLAALRAHRGEDGERFRTMVPLGIYCPPTRYVPWQLGRAEESYWRYDRALEATQEGRPAAERLVHHWDRLYVLLYRWIEGVDLEEAVRHGLLDEAGLRATTIRIAEEVWAAGFAVLDHKARHVIVRPDRRAGGLLRRGGEPVYALVDYELLVPVARG